MDVYVQMHLIILAWTLACLIIRNEAIIGYDCNSPKLEATTISTLDVASCDAILAEKSQKPEVKQEHIQLVQYNTFDFVEVKQCKISVSRTAYKCEGGFFHFMTNDEWIDVMPAGYRSFLYEITEDECMRAHEKKSVTLTRLNNFVLKNITNDETDLVRHVNLRGWINKKSNQCGGRGSYEDQYDKFPEHTVVEATLTISIHKQRAKVSIENNKIYLSSGTQCDFSSGKCRDSHFGHTFWRLPPPDSSCREKNKYSVLFNGKANVSTLNEETLYIVEESLTTFSLSDKGNIQICNKTFIKTEHPKLFIYTNADNLDFAPKAMENTDIFTYVNSKFVYVERHIRKQVENLHNDFRKHRCELERKILINRLSIAIIQPEEFAYRYTGQPGYMAVVAGEVIHVVKCNAIEVEARVVKDKCYKYLPVTYKLPPLDENDKAHFSPVERFITPQKHILVDFSPEIPCSMPFPQCWLIDGNWLQYTPEENKANNVPNILKPSGEATWRWEGASNISISGIYLEKDINEMNHRIMIPFIQEARVFRAVEQHEHEFNSNLWKGGFTPTVGDYFKSVAKFWSEASKTIVLGIIIIFAVIIIVIVVICLPQLCLCAKSLKSVLSGISFLFTVSFCCRKICFKKKTSSTKNKAQDLESK